MDMPKSLRVIDSHTGGEPTRVVVEGVPDLGEGTIAERLAVLERDFDHIRTSVILEPRGSDVMVGAVCLPPTNPDCAAGVIFFNNAGYLNMCGHGTIGLIATLAHLGEIAPGEHRIETPVGEVGATLGADGSVTIRNVPSYRTAADVEVAGVTGDVAWGGNWFFLTQDHGIPICLENVGALTDRAIAVREALVAAGISGDDGGEIDHIELVEPLGNGVFGARGFVLCPGAAYDRSPCGTGTSAKLACLYADGKITEGQIWRQESVVGSAFEGRVTIEGGEVVPHITGRAFVNGESRILFDPEDPFRFGIGR